jgi:general secretion pathway protein G
MQKSKTDMNKSAFTMLELVFVLVVLGILAAVALPRFGSISDSANVAKGQALIAPLRLAIASQRNQNLMMGDAPYPLILDDSTPNTSNEQLFDGNSSDPLLTYSIPSGTQTGNWMKTTNNAGPVIEYQYYISNGVTVDFNYTIDTGIFDCIHLNNDNCKSLTE